MKYTRPTDGLDKAARQQIEGANDNWLAVRSARECAWVQLDGYVDPPEAPDGYNTEVERESFTGVAVAYRFVPADTQPKPLTIIESPLAGDVDANMTYARTCLLDSLQRGEAPIASHLLHTQVLDDDIPQERKMGIEAGLAWYRVADKCVVYTGRGITKGMRAGIERADEYGVNVEYRQIETELESGEGQVAA